MSIISEILHGTWLLETTDPSAYKTIANTILGGGRLAEEKKQFYTVLSKSSVDAVGKPQAKDKVAVISMIGEMTRRGGLCSVGVEEIASELLRAENNPEIKGTIFYLDGPGGNADAMPVFQAIKSQLTKPVVALVARACSLHYWAASLLADHIMMENNLTAEVGSIGAMIMFEKPSNEIVIVRPEESSDKNQAFIEALEGDTKLLSERLKPLAVAFQNSVKENRPKVKEEDLKGKTFYADEAIQKGLADSIGDMQRAYNLVLTKAELKSTN